MKWVKSDSYIHRDIVCGDPPVFKPPVPFVVSVRLCDNRASSMRRHRCSHRRWMLRSISCLALVALAIGTSDQAHARKELLTPEEKAQLRRVERIHLETLALTMHGPADATPFTTAAAMRLEQLGYRIVRDAGAPVDVAVRIKCEEVKTWEGPIRSGGDADQVDAAARLWKGPACQLTYRIGSRQTDWHHEIRAETSQPGAGTTLAALLAQLRQDDFPYRLAAEWEQTPRLIAALDAKETTTAQRATIIGLLGTLQSPDSLARLNAALTNPDPAVARAAAAALGTVGQSDSIPALLALFTSGTPEQHRTAIASLGQLVPLHPNSAIVPTLVAALPHEPVANQILIVRALGASPDRRILEPLKALHRSVLKVPPEQITPELKELKSALGIALDLFDDGMHAD